MLQYIATDVSKRIQAHNIHLLKPNKALQLRFNDNAFRYFVVANPSIS